MSALAGLGVVGALAVGAGADPATVGQAAPGPPQPNVLVIETDDQTVESMRVMDNVNSLIGAEGATFTNSFVNFPLCCPSRATFLTGQYAHNHGVLGNAPPNGGFTRFQSLHGNNNLAVWMQRAGYYTGMIGKYLNRYQNDPPVPRGWSEWQAAPYPTDLKAYNYVLNERGTLVNYGQALTDFKQDVLTSKAVGFVNDRAPRPRPFFLWLTYTAPHTGGPDPNPNPPFNCSGGAKPAPRHALTFATEPLPQPPNFNEADVSDKPKPDPKPPAPELEPGLRHPAQVPVRAGVAAVGGRGREAGGGRLDRGGRAREHADHLYVGQRILQRRAPHPAGQAANLRGGDQGPPADAGSRHSTGRRGR